MTEKVRVSISFDIEIGEIYSPRESYYLAKVVGLDTENNCVTYQLLIDHGILSEPIQAEFEEFVSEYACELYDFNLRKV